jgi:hypothetical protein
MLFLPTAILAIRIIFQQATAQAEPSKPGQSTPPAAAAAAQGTEAPDTHPPAVSGGTPTVTDAAELSAPGWFELDPGVLKDLDRDALLGTPLTLKFTATNNRLQYLLGSDGFVQQDAHTRGVGDTYPGVHYLFLTQEKNSWDVAGKILLKVPTASQDLGGTGRFDYSGFVLASRDFTKWGFHGDFNAGVSALSRPNGPGYDNQTLVCGSTTSPIQGGRWQYTNELVYFSAIPGQDYRLTTMHGISYAAHRYATYSAGVQLALHGDIPRYQLLLAASFNIGHL